MYLRRAHQSGSPSMELDATDTSSNQSIQDAHPSAPTGATSIEQSPEGQSRPRVNSSSGSGSAFSGPGRKRRTPSSVTPNACTNCKKARAKVREILMLPCHLRELYWRKLSVIFLASATAAGLLASDAPTAMSRINATTTSTQRLPKNK